MLSAVGSESSNGSPTFGHDEPPARPILASLFTRTTMQVDCVKHGQRLSREQQLSRELQHMPATLVNATSAPEQKGRFPLPFPVSSPSPRGDIFQADLSISPAAMFLSSFSPSAASASSPSSEDEVVIAGYTLGPIIGVGGFSTVRQASSSQGGTVAVKIIRRADISRQADPTLTRRRLDHEATIWSSLSHEYILPLFSVTHTQHADCYITLYCPAGSLFDILKRDGRPGLLWDDAGMLFRQVVRGLRYLHEVAGVVHGDMKLENVLVDEMGVCKISDFGMARKIGECVDELDSSDARALKPRGSPPANSKRLQSKLGALPSHLSLGRHYGGSRHRNSSPLPASTASTSAMGAKSFQPGSLPYAAPELLLSSAAKYSPHPAQDIWALGVMLYALLTGRLPFVDLYDPRLQMKILHGVYDMPKGIGHRAERVLQGCLERSVPDRWTIAMVDEIAWGIVSGEIDDQVAISPKIASSQHSLKSRSRSRPGVVLDTGAIDDVDSRSRSFSRTSRSISRSPSAARRSSRSVSHSHPYELHQHHHPHPHPHMHQQQYLPLLQPSFSALNNAILRTSSASSSDSSESGPIDSAVLMTPSHSHDLARGRPSRPRWQAQPVVSDSRSVSPLVVARGTGHDSQIPESINKDAPHNVDATADENESLPSPLNFDESAVYVDENSQFSSDSGPQEVPDVPHPSARDQLWSVLEKDRRQGARRGSMPPTPAALAQTASTTRPRSGKAMLYGIPQNISSLFNPIPAKMYD